MSTQQRYRATAEELAQVCQSAGRNPQDVTLVAVSKTVDVPQVQQAMEAGAVNFGENRPDQLMLKADALPSVNWHFIGNIQSRRIRDIVGRATLIHSLYQEKHAHKIEQVAAEKDLAQDVLLEVNVSGEESKSGLQPAQVQDLLDVCLQLPHVRVCGLMTMAPQGDLQVASQTFAGLAQLRTQLQQSIAEGPYASEAPYFTQLSMGMSDDWREAVQQGATIVRVGRAIFSETYETLA